MVASLPSSTQHQHISTSEWVHLFIVNRWCLENWLSEIRNCLQMTRLTCSSFQIAAKQSDTNSAISATTLDTNSWDHLSPPWPITATFIIHPLLFNYHFLLLLLLLLHYFYLFKFIIASTPIDSGRLQIPKKKPLPFSCFVFPGFICRVSIHLLTHNISVTEVTLANNVNIHIQKWT